MRYDCRVRRQPPQAAAAKGGKAQRPQPSALEQALRVLSSRAVTLRQLQQALLRKRLPSDEIQAALARVKELGYIDDAEVARARAQRMVEKGCAPRLVARKLRAQGVAPEAANAASQEAAAGAGEEALAARALERKLRGRPAGDPRDRQRLFRALVAKGHAPAAAAKALELDLSEAFDDGIDEDR